MRNSGKDLVIVGRRCDKCVNSCTGGMGEITYIYTENETNMTHDQECSPFYNKLQTWFKQYVNKTLEQTCSNRYNTESSEHDWISQVHTVTVKTCH